MQQNFQTIKLPTTASQTTFTGGATWLNPTNILLNDGNDATIGLAGSGTASLFGTGFDFDFPPGAVIDGIELLIDSPYQSGNWSNIGIALGLVGTNSKNAITVNGSYGGPNDLWGLAVINPADISSINLELFALGTVDDQIYVNYMQVSVYWHIDLSVATKDVPTRLAYKVYSRDGNYLGELPNVTSRFGFSQDMDSAGSSITVTCAKYAVNEVSISKLLTEAGETITTESDLDILISSTDISIAKGNSIDDAIFKNSNRVMVWMYNYWYPNGKLMFAGQVNRLSFEYSGSSSVTMIVYSDGIDLDNYIARGYPFGYTTDVTQSAQNGYYIVSSNNYGQWERYGQTWLTGASVSNVGAIMLKLLGTATVTVSLYDSPNGNLLASTSRSIATGSPLDIQFEFAQLVKVLGSTTYFFTVSVPPGQSVRLYRNSANVYANGTVYYATFAGGSGGGSYATYTGDVYFITKSGVPTTTTTYSSKDPISGTMSDILTDYNSRGGRITARDLEPTGLSLTYTFSSATIFDALKKVIELAPSGYYSYIDLGTSEIDIKNSSTIADFTVVKGRDINNLNMALSIENVKNYLLLSGGETGGTNLFRYYQDTESSYNYGVRLSSKSDNRVTLANTADAIGSTFIGENAHEVQETTLTLLNTSVDITKFIPGKTIGFRSFGSFIDDMVLQVVRRSLSPDTVTLTLGRLPVSTTAEIQRLNRELTLEQTINNPTQPS